MQVTLGGGPDVGGAQTAIKFPGTAVLHPLRYIQGLANAITSKYGGRIYEQSRVRKHDQSNKVLTTMDGFKVQVKDAMVLATGAPVTANLVDSALHALALHSKQHPRRRWVVMV